MECPNNSNIARGDCYVTIETSGATPIPGVWAKPDDIRGVALLIVSGCVQQQQVGGFGTLDFQNLVTWNREHPQTAELWRARPPVSASFMTITVTGPRGKQTLLSPGNVDPAIPIAVARATYTTAQEMARSPALVASSEFWVAQANRMERGGAQTWWQLQPPKAPPEMTYKCEANLGRPPVVDCTQIEWNQLSPPSDTLNVGPGVTFLHSNSCYLAISVTAALVLTWEQIRTAVATLMNVCINTPYNAPQGGSAYWTPPAKAIGGKNKRRRRQSHDLTGLNALPPHVNITIFEQREAWKNPIDELKTCTWQAVAHGNPINSCIAA